MRSEIRAVQIHFFSPFLTANADQNIEIASSTEQELARCTTSTKCPKQHFVISCSLKSPFIRNCHLVIFYQIKTATSFQLISLHIVTIDYHRLHQITISRLCALHNISRKSALSRHELPMPKFPKLIRLSLRNQHGEFPSQLYHALSPHISTSPQISPH